MRLLTLSIALSLLPLFVPSRGDAAGSAARPAAIFQNLEAGKHQTVVVYGTSLTHGGAWTTETKRWFDKEFPGEVTFVNSGGPGKNSDWGVENLKAKVLDHHPDLVFIEFSYNDAHDKFKMPVEKGASNLKTMVDAIRGQNPDVIIILQTMNVGWDAPNGNRSLSVRPDLEKCNDNYRNLARAEGLPLLDHYASWLKLKESEPKTYQKYVPDGTHPTAQGSVAVTWPTVKTWLEKTRAEAESTPRD